MAKPHVSLEALAGATPVVVASLRPVVVPVKPTKWRAHTSLYISRNVQRMIRRIAADLDRKPHDLLLEAVNDVLGKYGKPGIAELDASPATGR
jgi:hypothetical protein